MKILFSPIGMTDPVHHKNLEEGSLLQICRKIEPDKIFLFYSKEVVELHNLDNRYLLSLEEVYKSLNKELEVEIISRPELVEVQIFDYFYKDFRDILDNIHSSFPNDSLYVNISSGTPAMKNALFILSAVSKYKILPIQVDTPAKQSNTDVVKYDLEGHLDMIKDFNVDKSYINRAHLVKMDNLNYEIKKEILINHLNKFDYSAALDVAESIKEFLPNNTFHLINAAFYRSNLDLKRMNRHLEMARDSFYMYDKEYKIIIEYLLYLDILLKRNLLLEFIRGITPAIFHLFKLIVEIDNNINLSNYIKVDKEEVEYWSEEKLNSNKVGLGIIATLNKGYRFNFDFNSFVKSDHFAKLINDEKYCKSDKLVKIVNTLRKVELDVRNKAAHQIVSIDDKKLKEKTGYVGREIFDFMKEIVSYLNIKLSNNHWNSYLLMNEQIIASLIKNENWIKVKIFPKTYFRKYFFIEIVIDICHKSAIILLSTYVNNYLWGDFMPRPTKFRKVCCLPSHKHFGPLDSHSCNSEAIVLFVDELEAIRLIDFEGLTQEECAEQMGVARTTVQGIYLAARKKIADALVNGKRLFIDGGCYKVCDGIKRPCGKVCKRFNNERG